jgi:hypothetical protein
MMTPQNMSSEELLNILDAIRNGVANGDTLGGRIEFVLSERTDVPHPYDVTAVYRVGQRLGQGGLSVVGEFGGGQ